MTAQSYRFCVRVTEDEFVLLLTLLDSTIGGPTWRHDEREGKRLIRKIENAAICPQKESRSTKGVSDGNDHKSLA